MGTHTPGRWRPGAPVAYTRLLLGLGLIVAMGLAAGCSATDMLAGVGQITRVPPVTATATTVGDASIELSPAQGGPGTRIAVNGRGWTPGDTIYLDLEDPNRPEGRQRAYAGAIVSGDGTFSLLITFPFDAGLAGLPRVQVTAWSSANGRMASADFAVVSATPEATATLASTIATATIPVATATPGEVIAAVTAPSDTSTPGATVTDSVLPVISTPEPQTSNVGIVTGEALNMHTGPGSEFPLITTLAAGDRFVAGGQNAAGDWLHVQLANGQQGWVYRTSTDFLGSVSVIEAPPAPVAAPPPIILPLIMQGHAVPSWQDPVPPETPFEKQVSLRGTIESLPPDGPAGAWMVGGWIVHVYAETHLDAGDAYFAPGFIVEVQGWLQPDGWLAANKIELRETQGSGEDRESRRGDVNGTVRFLPGDDLFGIWLVDDVVVRVDSFAEIKVKDSAPAVGAPVRVKGWWQGDDLLWAEEVEFEGEDDHESDEGRGRGNGDG